MAYSKRTLGLLKKAGVNEGDWVKVTTPAAGYEGIILPRIDAGNPDALVIKLESGYNAGVEIGPDVNVERIDGNDGQRPERKPASEAAKHLAANLPQISMVSTGGTISAKVDYKLGGVRAALTPEEIYATTPELAEVAGIKSFASPFRTFSENMTPPEWGKIAVLVAKELNSGAKGVIVTHGTDTLHYTAAALGFMLPNLPKPVALVGAQRSPDRGSFDGAQNLLCGAYYAGHSNFAEVAIVMHANSSDDFCNATRGVKARKMHSTRRDAFRPVNDLPIARIWPDGRMEEMKSLGKRDDSAKAVADIRFEGKTALVKAYPGSDPGILDYLVGKKCRGIIVEATALGHVPADTIEKKYSWVPAIKNAIEEGAVVGFATQCLYGTASPYVYETARMLHGMGALYCADMLPEVAYVKLGCMLGRSKDSEKVKKMMLTNSCGEINERHSQEEFLY
ncbi:Glu-tRNA(Gln) amidotransferase subunit GatD [Candidatus Micrarchaeota archaeon]|nr:Glu-tRNA(Gln) amidotransferase subunit GatD [Candidatus Micrarchaeota archaeon]MBI5177481.1 Glu-tRNA(Gln) amidotransferase subunit GatD [Candidatus Micrarchaeota archaeon]